jgi:hypothetical protein
MKSDETRPVNIGNPVEYSVREIAEIGARSHTSLPMRTIPGSDALT